MSANPSYLPNSEPHCHKLPEISFPSLLLCKWTHNPIQFSHQLPSFSVDPLPNSDTPDLWPKSPVRTPGSSPGFSHEFYVKSCSQIFPLLLCKTGPPLSYVDAKNWSPQLIGMARLGMIGTHSCSQISLLTLGERGHLSSRYIVISLWFLKQCIQKVSSRYMLNSFKKYPSIQSQCNQGVHADYFLKVITKATSGYFVNGTPEFFHNFM